MEVRIEEPDGLLPPTLIRRVVQHEKRPQKTVEIIGVGARKLSHGWNMGKVVEPVGLHR